MQILGMIPFAFALTLAVLVGMFAVSWIIAEAIMFVLPGLQPRVMKIMGWREYKPVRGEVHAFREMVHSVQQSSHVSPPRDRERPAFIALRGDAVCRGCSKRRKIFHVESRLCTRCHNTPQPTAA